MERRGPARLVALLVAIVAALVVATPAHTHASPTVGLVATPADDAPVAPPDTVTEFYPEDANLSDCVGLVEKPGCGSESRGGWRQTMVFVVLFAGLGVILWRVSRGIRANRDAIDRQAVGRADDSADQRPNG